MTMKKLSAIILLSSALAGNATDTYSQYSSPQMAGRQYSTNYLCEVKAEKAHSGGMNYRKEELSFPKKILIEKAPKKHRINSYGKGILEIYFTTNSWALHHNDIEDINSYSKIAKKVDGFLLEGYADFRGPSEWNIELSRRRAEGISARLRRNLGNRDFQIAAYGDKFSQPEGTPVKELSIDRRVTILPNQTVISRGLNQFISDYYLIDQSGSMDERIGGSRKSKWDEVIAFKFPSGSKVYTFTSDNRRCNTNLNDEKPKGSTPLFSSLESLIEIVERNKKITVLTDGINNVPGSPDRIIGLANQKGITIHFVGLDLPPQYKIELVRIAGATGGKVLLH